ncbi:hypothetical protein EAH89_26160 [Roseomonas nepalensis]|uniref:Twin-arginine translocation signal domain-containing protein n=1 Tax=Muricoccus nepalensis TaxID=1854500 RepID=A0A502F8K0_9PROT|nr:hypothetical protein [Roseomonas nepalensis]TPG45689.1 hypothetical protein EAH89_26160 [Roseomonas nepalensis]
MSRRNLLGGLAVLVTVTPALATHATHPDAALLAACAEHMKLAAEEKRLLHAMRAFDVSPDCAPAVAAEKVWDAACDRANTALKVITGMQAATLEGAAAKARSVMAYVRSIENPGDTDAMLNFDEIAARSVLRDLERMAGGAA